MQSVFGFTGAYGDPVSFDYPLGHGYRRYWPELMRFNADDELSPFGLGGINPYIYCAGDPINRSDPTGGISIASFMNFVRGVCCIRLPEENGMTNLTMAENRADATTSSGRKPSTVVRRADTETAFGVSRHDSQNEIWETLLKNDSVAYVHGSNSASMEGVAKFRALLSMKEINATPWFFRAGAQLPSGEGKFTVFFLKDNHVASTGVSMWRRDDASSSVKEYSKLRNSESVFPILYGIDDEVETFPAFTHLISRGAINIDHIRAIYVPENRVVEARGLLLEYGSEKLSSRVKGSTIFNASCQGGST